MLMLTRRAFQNNTSSAFPLTLLSTQRSNLNELPCVLAARRKRTEHTIHRKHENPPLSKSGNNTLLSVRPTQKPLRCTLLFLRFSEKASVQEDDILWFMPRGHSIVEQCPESFHRTKWAAGELVNGKMLSLIARNMNGKRPHLISKVQYFCEMFVGHHSPINLWFRAANTSQVLERDGGKLFFFFFYKWHRNIIEVIESNYDVYCCRFMFIVDNTWFQMNKTNLSWKDAYLHKHTRSHRAHPHRGAVVLFSNSARFFGHHNFWV